MAAATTTAVESADSVVVFMESSTDGYLFLVEEAGTGSIQAGEVTLIAKIAGVTDIAPTDLVSYSGNKGETPSAKRKRSLIPDGVGFFCSGKWARIKQKFSLPCWYYRSESKTQTDTI